MNNDLSVYRPLLSIARESIENELADTRTGISVKKHDDADASTGECTWLFAPGACFVTLLEMQNLRGCVGSIDAYRPLIQDVRENAVAAAFHDARFNPVTADELPWMTIEISLLSERTVMTFNNEQDLIEQLRPGTDGVVLEFGYYRSTYLPQVWEHIPEPRAFISQLKQKAGLSWDFWSEHIKISRYEVGTLSELELYGG